MVFNKCLVLLVKLHLDMNRAWKISIDTGKAQSHSRSGTTMACLCEPVQPLSRSWTENDSKTARNLKENGKQFLSNFISISKGRSVLGISQTWNTCTSTFKLVFMIKCNLVILEPESGWDKKRTEKGTKLGWVNKSRNDLEIRANLCWYRNYYR